MQGQSAAELLVGQIAQMRRNPLFAGAAVNLENNTEENELLEIRQELAAQGYIRREQTKNGRPQKIPPTRPERFVAPDGTEIFVGKNNVQNDHLTFSAMPEDIWLHTQNIPGSHVIIRMSGAEQWPADETLLYAARIAARYSKARHSSQVPVDYTHRRYVKKPSGAKPGFVHYTHQFTVYVEPCLDSGGKNDTIKTVSFIPRRFAAQRFRPGMRRGMHLKNSQRAFGRTNLTKGWQIGYDAHQDMPSLTLTPFEDQAAAAQEAAQENPRKTAAVIDESVLTPQERGDG
jgi:hypothetical protein